MKRRGFLAALGGLFGGAVVAKVAPAAPASPPPAPARPRPVITPQEGVFSFESGRHHNELREYPDPYAVRVRDEHGFTYMPTGRGFDLNGLVETAVRRVG